MDKPLSSTRSQVRTPLALATAFKIYLGLLFLLALTVYASMFQLGSLSLLVAFGIAALKAALVMWFYMDLKRAPQLTLIAAAVGFVWIIIMFVLTYSDYASRGTLGIFGK